MALHPADVSAELRQARERIRELEADLVRLGARLLERETCGRCGHAFDRDDRRGFVPTHRRLYPELTPVCPACHQMSDAAEAWAVWNGCQGIFTCSIFHRRREAEDCLRATFSSASERVVPVRVLIEPEDDWWLREEREREADRDDPAPPSGPLRVVK